MLMHFIKLLFFFVACSTLAQCAPPETSTQTPLQRPSSSFVIPDFTVIDLWEIPDALDLSHQDIRYRIDSSGYATAGAGDVTDGTDEFERIGTFDVRLFARLGALLKARSYDKFKDVYPTTPKAAALFDDRARTILFFSLAHGHSLQHQKHYIYDYADSAPLAVWELETAVRGIIQQVEWSGPPLPPVNPSSGIRGVVSDQVLSRERKNNYFMCPIVVLSAKDKHEVTRTFADSKFNFTIGLVPGKYTVVIQLPEMGLTPARQISRLVEVKENNFVWVDATF